MRRLWAGLVAVWATLAILGVLAWTRPPAGTLPQATPVTMVVKGNNGATHLVVVQTATHATTHTSPPPP
jgi:hypothetical protein